MEEMSHEYQAPDACTSDVRYCRECDRGDDEIAFYDANTCVDCYAYSEGRYYPNRVLLDGNDPAALPILPDDALEIPISEMMGMASECGEVTESMCSNWIDGYNSILREVYGA